MINQNQFYKMYLEDYRNPRMYRETRAYYGKLEDFLGLAARLSEKKEAAICYADTIEAMESYYLDQNITHWMAGRMYPLLTPVDEICRYDTILENQKWEYHAISGAVCALRAKRVRVSQILIQTEDGFERCIKANFTGLEVCIPGMGWYCPNVAIRGFPGVVTWDENVHTVHLFSTQCRYRFEEREQALKDITDIGKIRLEAAVGDIFGEV